MNYEIIPYWDLDMLLVFVLGNVSNIALTGLAYEGVMGVTGAPAAIAGKWVPGAQVHNIVDGTWYENTGTTASPVWSLVPSTGSGITTLTGDVDAGPGTGSQAAEVKGFYSVPLTAAATVNASFYVFDSTPGEFNPVVMSGDATMDNAGIVTVTGSNDDFTVGGSFFDSVAGNLAAPSVLPVTNGQLEITTTGTADAFSLPDGAAGQTLTILYVADGAGSDSAVVTPTNLIGGTTITFNDLGDTALLKFSATGGWYFVSGTAILA